ncbi:MAG: SGNH/GDSL hydrolase family protein [Verrucomicrobiae bacterium]|nr:SGNH/GDSL hydrolase family protein [Verrucomicrobiae bacterium]
MVGSLSMPLIAADPESKSAGFADGEHVVLIGNTLADRMQYSGWLETRLQLAFPGKHLTLRNMGWSADEVALMPRPLEFGPLETHLTHQKADTILMCFGGNESFAGESGLAKFKVDLVALVERLKGQKFNGTSAPRLILVSPIAHEQLGKPWPDAAPRNVELERYTATMRESAAELGLEFIDLFHPTRTLMAENQGAKMTINGIHLTDEGYRTVTEIIALGLGVSDPLPRDTGSLQALRDAVIEKNRQFFLRWRPVNAEYVFGRRKEPFGVLSFPPEMAQLDRQIADLDQQIWKAAETLAKQP